jgi:transcriptional regulator GlxA family with amidase domain
VLGAYVEAIASADPSTSGMIRQRAAYRLEVVRRADAAMQTSLIGTSNSSGDFCKGLGMSERNLELYFREAIGISPKKWVPAASR